MRARGAARGGAGCAQPKPQQSPSRVRAESAHRGRATRRRAPPPPIHPLGPVGTTTRVARAAQAARRSRGRGRAHEKGLWGAKPDFRVCGIFSKTLHGLVTVQVFF